MSLCHPWDASRVAEAAFDLVGSADPRSISTARAIACAPKLENSATTGLGIAETSFFAGGRRMSSCLTVPGLRTVGETETASGLG